MENEKIDQQIASLSEPLNYGEADLELLIQRFKETSGQSMWAAYRILLQRTEASIKQILWTYNPYRFFECLRTLGEEGLDLDLIEAVAISPDGKIVVGSFHDTRIKVWDLTTGQELYTFMGHPESVRSVAISPDGRHVMTLGYHPRMSNRTIRLWDLKTGQQISRRIGYSGYVHSFIIGNNGQTLIISGKGHKITLWDLNTNREIRTIEEESETDILRALLVWYGFNRSLLICSSYGYSISVWDLETGQLLHRLTKHTEEGLQAAISPDGRILVTSGDDRQIIIWDLDVGEELYTIKGLKGHSDYVKSVAFSPDGQTFATGSWDKTIKIWDLNTTEEISILEGHTDFVTSIIFSRDGQTLISGSYDGTIKVWGVGLENL